MVQGLKVMILGVVIISVMIFRADAQQPPAGTAGSNQAQAQAQHLRQEIQGLHQQLQPLRSQLQQLMAQSKKIREQMHTIEERLKADYQQMQVLRGAKGQ